MHDGLNRAIPSAIFFPTAKGGDHINHVGATKVSRFDFGQHHYLNEQIERPEHNHEWGRFRLPFPLHLSHSAR